MFKLFHFKLGHVLKNQQSFFLRRIVDFFTLPLYQSNSQQQSKFDRFDIKVKKKNGLKQVIVIARLTHTYAFFKIFTFINTHNLPNIFKYVFDLL